MEYVYAALLLHKLKKDINEENIKNIIKAVGVEPDEIRIKALVAALQEVNIDDALKSTPLIGSPIPSTQTTPTTTTQTQPKEVKEEKKEEEKKGEEEAMAGLAALFG